MPELRRMPFLPTCRRRGKNHPRRPVRRQKLCRTPAARPLTAEPEVPAAVRMALIAVWGVLAAVRMALIAVWGVLAVM
jgi:hypothetical protein